MGSIVTSDNSIKYYETNSLSSSSVLYLGSKACLLCIETQLVYLMISFLDLLRRQTGNAAIAQVALRVPTANANAVHEPADQTY